MNKSELFAFMNENPVFYLATMDGNQPRVRGMFLFRADENGIIFHTGTMKDVYAQIMKNSQVELCFFGKGIQVRVTGVLEASDDMQLREEIFAHPSRKFLQAWKENGIESMLKVFILRNGTAVTWTMDTNFDKKQPVQL